MSYQMNGWHYSRPNTNRNKEGNIVLIKAVSYGPAEVHEWGINASGKPYVLHQWLENDFYEDSNRERIISRGELAGELQRLISRFQAEGRQDWAAAYENALLWLNNH